MSQASWFETLVCCRRMATSLGPDREQDTVHDKLSRIIRGWGSDVPERLRCLLDEEGGSQSQERETKHADNEN